IEGPEYFDMQLSLTGPTQAVMGDGTGRVTILDGAPATRFVTTNKKINGGTALFDASISPNPSNHEFILNIQTDRSETAEIRILDAQGRVVKQLKTVANNLRFGNELRDVIYMIEIRQGSNRKILKAIKF
ncbi:MAG TPA: T9SS type A sorting domain-containing protein, partial [Chitinophagaceae bacterium]